MLLKNVHLAPSWLVTVEKKLHTLTPHPGFRLFMTMEINPKVPVNLLRASRAFVYEPPPGIKANLLRTYSTIPSARMCQGPGERARLYFLLAWFHAIVQERLRYAPLGWSKGYEFSESDLKVACDMLDTWIDSVCQVGYVVYAYSVNDGLRSRSSMSGLLDAGIYIYTMCTKSAFGVGAFGLDAFSRDVLMFYFPHRVVPISHQTSCLGTPSKLCWDNPYMVAKLTTNSIR